MKFDPQQYHRRSIRLQGYDYSQAGAYFVTIVAQGRACLFGEIVKDEIVLNPAGMMVQTAWQSLPKRFNNIEPVVCVIMPNRFHAIVIVNEPVGAGLVPALADRAHASGASGATTRVAPTKPTLGQIIGAFKSITTHEYIQGVNCLGWPAFDKRLWQRNYYEHIIRNSNEADRIQNYVESNPVMWNNDEENPGCERNH